MLDGWFTYSRSPAEVDPDCSIREASPYHEPGGENPGVMLVLLMEQAAAWRKRGQLLGLSWWWSGGENPRGRKRGGTRTHRGMCCPTRYRWKHQHRSLEVHSRQQKSHHSNQIWPDIFSNRSTDGQNSNDAGHHKTMNRESQNSGKVCMGFLTAGNGARGRASEFPRSDHP